MTKSVDVIPPAPVYRKWPAAKTARLHKILDEIEAEFGRMKWVVTRSRPNVSGLSHMSSNMRRGFPCDSMVFGKLRKFGFPLNPSKFNAMYPLAWELLQKLGKELNHPWTTITINRNLACLPHKDGNIGQSIIVGMGQFTGGELCVKRTDDAEPVAYNVCRKFLQFDGNLSEHWVTEFEGLRYSIVFYTKKPIKSDTGADKAIAARAITKGAIVVHGDREDDGYGVINDSSGDDTSDNTNEPPAKKQKLSERSKSRTKSKKKTDITARRRRFAVAIPSFQRPEVLVIKTLPLVRRLHPSLKNVTVFVANKTEASNYTTVLKEAGFDKVNVVVGVKGLLRQRVFYNTKFYKPNTLIMNMDDDIDDLKVPDPSTNRLKSFRGTLDDLIQRMATLCEEHGARLCGLYPTANAFYMKNHHTVGLRYIVGAAFLSYAGDNAICGSDRVSKESSGEDFETCLRSFVENGSVVRIEDVAIKTSYFAGGGIDAELQSTGHLNRKNVHEAALHAIQNKYPDLARLVQKKDVVNLRLKLITTDRK